MDARPNRTEEESVENEGQTAFASFGRKSVLDRLHRNEAIVAARKIQNIAERPLARVIGVR